MSNTYLTRAEIVEELNLMLDESESPSREWLEDLLKRASVPYRGPGNAIMDRVETELWSKPTGVTYKELRQAFDEDPGSSPVRQAVSKLREKYGDALVVEVDHTRQGMYGNKPKVISLYKPVHAKLTALKRQGRRIKVTAVEKAASCSTEQAEKLLRYHGFKIKNGAATP